MIGSLTALILAAAAQSSAEPDQVRPLRCGAVSVSGSTLDFALELKGSAEGGEARLPTRNAAFVAASDRKFRIADLPNTLIFRLYPLPLIPGSHQITLFLGDKGDAGFPIAEGYCKPAGKGAPPAAAAVPFASLTDAALSKAADDHLPCFLLTYKGEISRFKTHLVERGPELDRVFEPLDGTIWSGTRTSADKSLPSVPPGTLVKVYSIFGGADEESPNPTGLSTGYIDPARALAVGTFKFNRLGRGVSAEDGEGVGICALKMRASG